MGRGMRSRTHLSLDSSGAKCATAFADMAGQMRQELVLCSDTFGASPLNMLGRSFSSSESVPPDAVDEVQIFTGALTLAQLQDLRDSYAETVSPSLAATRLPQYDLSCSPLSSEICGEEITRTHTLQRMALVYRLRCLLIPRRRIRRVAYSTPLTAPSRRRVELVSWTNWKMLLASAGRSREHGHRISG